MFTMNHSCNRKLYGIGILTAILYCTCLLFALVAGILGLIAYWEVAERPLRSAAGVLQLLAFLFALIAAFRTPFLIHLAALIRLSK